MSKSFSLIASCFALIAMTSTVNAQTVSFDGAVYAMTNNFEANSVVAYGRGSDGMLTMIGEVATGGAGAAFDGGEGLDPLISAYALLATDDRKYLLAVNAGSSTITSMRINADFSLTVVDSASVAGVGPNSIAYHNGLIYVSTIDSDGVFNGEPDQEGSLTGIYMNDEGYLIRLFNSERRLGNRPSAVQFSPDGRFLVVSSINAGSSALASGSDNEMVVYAVNRNFRLSAEPVSTATSTPRGNTANRNLPSGIGFEVVQENGRQYVVTTEAREFQADGSPPAFPALQTGSVSSWELDARGQLIPVNLDVLTGTSPTEGGRTACWIEFSRNEGYFWVSNALEATISAFSFADGNITLLDVAAASGQGPNSTVPAEAFANTDGFIDMWISDDGRYLYQLYGLSGTVGVFSVSESDGFSLELIQTVTGLPLTNTQGIVAF